MWENVALSDRTAIQQQYNTRLGRGVGGYTLYC